MNNDVFTETFQDFAAKVGPMDLALYAGVGLVIWVLFQDKLVSLKDVVVAWFSKINLRSSTTPSAPTTIKSNVVTDDKFFQLVSSWKKTRDLAASIGCAEAVKVADQMFPYLSPQVCNKEKDNVQ